MTSPSVSITSCLLTNLTRQDSKRPVDAIEDRADALQGVVILNELPRSRAKRQQLVWMHRQATNRLFHGQWCAVDDRNLTRLDQSGPNVQVHEIGAQVAKHWLPHRHRLNREHGVPADH